MKSSLTIHAGGQSDLIQEYKKLKKDAVGKIKADQSLSEEKKKSLIKILIEKFEKLCSGTTEKLFLEV